MVQIKTHKLGNWLKILFLPPGLLNHHGKTRNLLRCRTNWLEEVGFEVANARTPVLFKCNFISIRPTRKLPMIEPGVLRFGEVC